MPEDTGCSLCNNPKSSRLFEIETVGAFPESLRPPGVSKIIWRRCEGCGMIFLSPRPDEQESFSIYDEDYYEIDRERQRHKEYVLKACEVEKFASGGTLLDAGCGAGGFLRSLGERWSASGIDPSPAACSIATNSFNVKVQCASIEDYETPVKFDAVTMWDMIEHTHNPIAALRNANKALKTGGVLGISCALADSLVPSIAGSRWRFFNAPDHLFAFTTKTLSAALSNSGFKIRRIRKLNGNFEFLSDFAASLSSEIFEYFRQFTDEKKLASILKSTHPIIPMFADVAIVIATKTSKI